MNQLRKKEEEEENMRWSNCKNIFLNLIKKHNILIFYENEYYVNYMFGMFMISQLFFAIYFE